MALWEYFMESCIRIDKKTVDDGQGGYETEWTEGARFRAAVVKHLVPLCESIYRAQAKRLGAVYPLSFADAALMFRSGNPRPQGTAEDVLAAGRTFYDELSPETSAYFGTLLDRGYLREAGTADTPGNPVLYATTQAFLERYGLKSLADLPDLEEFAPDEKTAQLIRERLGAPAAAFLHIHFCDHKGIGHLVAPDNGV